MYEKLSILMKKQELKDLIEDLLKRPEGLKFDFKAILHIADCPDTSKKDKYRNEL